MTKGPQKYSMKNTLILITWKKKDNPVVELWEELADDDGVFYEEFTRVITN